MVWWRTWYPSADALTIGSVHITWYGIILLSAVAVGAWVVRHIFQKKQIPLDHLYGLLFWVLISSIIGGRLAHIIAEWKAYQAVPAQMAWLWEGGMSFHGVLIAAVIAVHWYCRHYRLSFWSVADSIAIAAPVMQAIGRWGNYFNQELFGPPTGHAWGIPIAPANRPVEFITNEHFHPLFLYESLFMIALFAVLWVLYRRSVLRDGEYVLLYVFIFSVIRFFLDFLRINPPELGQFSIAQWVSMLLIIGSGYLWFRRRVSKTIIQV